jgi:hypothetical protein
MSHHHRQAQQKADEANSMANSMRRDVVALEHSRDELSR